MATSTGPGDEIVNISEEKEGLIYEGENSGGNPLEILTIKDSDGGVGLYGGADAKASGECTVVASNGSTNKKKRKQKNKKKCNATTTDSDVKANHCLDTASTGSFTSPKSDTGIEKPVDEIKTQAATSETEVKKHPSVSVIYHYGGNDKIGEQCESSSHFTESETIVCGKNALKEEPSDTLNVTPETAELSKEKLSTLAQIDPAPAVGAEFLDEQPKTTAETDLNRTVTEELSNEQLNNLTRIDPKDLEPDDVYNNNYLRSDSQDFENRWSEEFYLSQEFNDILQTPAVPHSSLVDISLDSGNQLLDAVAFVTLPVMDEVSGTATFMDDRFAWKDKHPDIVHKVQTDLNKILDTASSKIQTLLYREESIGIGDVHSIHDNLDLGPGLILQDEPKPSDSMNNLYHVEGDPEYADRYEAYTANADSEQTLHKTPSDPDSPGYLSVNGVIFKLENIPVESSSNNDVLESQSGQSEGFIVTEGQSELNKEKLDEDLEIGVESANQETGNSVGVINPGKASLTFDYDEFMASQGIPYCYPCFEPALRWEACQTDTLDDDEYFDAKSSLVSTPETIPKGINDPTDIWVQEIIDIGKTEEPETEIKDTFLTVSKHTQTEGEKNTTEILGVVSNTKVGTTSTSDLTDPDLFDLETTLTLKTLDVKEGRIENQGISGMSEIESIEFLVPSMAVAASVDTATATVGIDHSRDIYKFLLDRYLPESHQIGLEGLGERRNLSVEEFETLREDHLNLQSASSSFEEVQREYTLPEKEPKCSRLNNLKRFIPCIPRTSGSPPEEDNSANKGLSMARTAAMLRRFSERAASLGRSGRMNH